MGHFNDDRSSTNLNKEEEEDIISLADELLEDSSTHEEYAAGWPDFMDFHGLSVDEQVDYSSNNHSHNNPHDELIISSMKQDDDEDDERNMCLNLRLNYEQVLEAWPHRTPIWAAAAADDDAYVSSHHLHTFFFIFNFTYLIFIYIIYRLRCVT